MVTDQEPRYRFKDPATGDIVGTVFERGGELVVQEGTSGNENELVLQSDGTVQAKRLTGGYLYAAAFDGADADARLDNALAAAVGGDKIRLENATYNANRTITSRVKLAGPSKLGTDAGALLDADWTLDTTVALDELRINGGSLTFNGNRCSLQDSYGTGDPVTVDADKCHIIGCGNLDVTFNSGTQFGIVDASSLITVTDNGSNTVGDIS